MPKIIEHRFVKAGILDGDMDAIVEALQEAAAKQ